MNKLLFLFCSCFLGFLNGQDFQAIYPNSLAHFGEHNYPLQIVNTTQNGDSIFYHGFSMIRSVQHQLKLNGEHWTGEKIGVLPNGDYIFSNKRHQAIRIKSQANLNETWHLFDFEDGNYLLAKVSLLQPENFLGITENVKTISLQLKNSDGENLESPFNEMTIKISENHGFTRLFNFYRFPFTENIHSLYPFQKEMDLVGFDDLGYQPFGAKEIFGFEVGDVLHKYEYFWEFDSSEAVGELQKKDITTFLEKEVQVNENTVTYEIETCGYSKIYDYVENEWNETTTFVYDFNLPKFQQLNQINFKAFHNPETENYVVTYAKGRDKRILYEFQGSEEALEEVYRNQTFLDFGESEPDQYEKLYKKHLGGPYHSHQLMCCINLNHLQYYSIEGETYGSPFEFSCSENASTQDVSSSHRSFKVYPNPTTSYFSIDDVNDIQSINIFDNEGKLVKSFSDKLTKYAVEELNSGIYFVEIFTKKGKIRFKLIKK